MFFDIETIPYDFDTLDSHVQHTVLKGTTENTLEAEQAKLKMGLSPYLGEIVAIGFTFYPLNAEKLSKVYFQAPSLSKGTVIDDKEVIFVVTDERQMLCQFWAYAKESADNGHPFVTFNGRSFDAPWIIIRSMKYGLRPTINLLPPRYDNKHIDLKDRLSLFGSLRWPSFHIVCNHFEVQTPKQQLDGSQVKNAYDKGDYLKIARYCAQDVLALEEVYNIYQKVSL